MRCTRNADFCNARTYRSGRLSAKNSCRNLTKILDDNNK